MLDAWIGYVNRIIIKQKYFELPNKNQLKQCTQKKIDRKKMDSSRRNRRSTNNISFSDVLIHEIQVCTEL